MSSTLHHAAASVGKSAPLGPLPEWNLNDLYKGIDAPEVAADLAKGDAECAAFEETYKGKLGAIAAAPGAGEKLAAAVKRFEAIEDLLGKLISYAGLVYTGDTTDPKRAKFFGDVQEKITTASSHPPVLHAGAQPHRGRADRAGASAPRVRPLPAVGRGRSQGAAVSARRQARAAIPRKIRHRARRVESPVRRDDRGAEIQDRRRGVVARTRAQRADGSERGEAPRGRGRNLACAAERSPHLHAGHQCAGEGQGNFRPAGAASRTSPTTAIFPTASSRSWSKRWFPPCVASFPRLSHRYYALKAKWFGKKQLEYWDRNAPLPKVETRTIGWNEARDTVLSAYGAFSPQMASVAKRFFDDRWIDAPARPGKSPGAFAHPTVPSAHPYVLVNYLGKPRDVMTLAHELGHGVHQVLAAPNGALMAPTPLTLAETASVFGEMLTFRSLLAKITDPREKKAMLAQKVEDMLNTVVRQIAFYAFERKIHTERKNGELTSEQIGQNLAGGAGRKPRAPRFISARATTFTGPISVTSCTRRFTFTPMHSAMPGELALCRVRKFQRGIRRALSRDARRRRHQAPFRIVEAVWP